MPGPVDRANATADLPLLGFSPDSHLTVCGRNHPSVDHPTDLPACADRPLEPPPHERSRAPPRFPETPPSLESSPSVRCSHAPDHGPTSRFHTASPEFFCARAADVAACCRPWGSLRFADADPKADRFPAARSPLEGLPPASAPPRSLAAPCPRVVRLLQLLRLSGRALPHTRIVGHRRDHRNFEALLRCEVGVRPTTVAGRQGPVLPGLPHLRHRLRGVGGVFGTPRVTPRGTVLGSFFDVPILRWN